LPLDDEGGGATRRNERTQVVWGGRACSPPKAKELKTRASHSKTKIVAHRNKKTKPTGEAITRNDHHNQGERQSCFTRVRSLGKTGKNVAGSQIGSRRGEPVNSQERPRSHRRGVPGGSKRPPKRREPSLYEGPHVKKARTSYPWQRS